MVSFYEPKKGATYAAPLVLSQFVVTILSLSEVFLIEIREENANTMKRLILLRILPLRSMVLTIFG